MEDQLDLKLCEDSLEQAAIEDRSGDFAIDLLRDCRIERRQIERDDGALGTLGQAIDQAVSDLAVRARDENDRFAHLQNYTEP
jgi:hypothetical protein